MPSSVVNTVVSGAYKFACFLIGELYKLIMLLSDINLFNNSKFNDMSKRFLALAGVFIIFKIAIAVIKYVLEPDKLMNTSTGIQKVIVRILIVVALLTSYNTIFEQAMNLQQQILSEGTINKIVFGNKDKCSTKKMSNGDNAKNLTKVTNFISYTMLAPFIYYNDKAFEDIKEGCVDKDTGEKLLPFTSAIGTMGDACGEKEPTVKEFGTGDQCYEVMWDGINSSYKEQFIDAIKEYDMPKAWSYVAALKRNGETIFHASLLSPLITIILIIILAIITFRVAIRTVKLSFMRVIAPIPIITYVDVSDSGDKTMFKKWLNYTIKVYLELFIQLLAIMFAIFILSEFIGSGQLKGYSGTTYDWKSYPLVNILMIVGCFAFALQLPTLIGELTGAKTDGIAKAVRKGASALGAGALGFVGGASTGLVSGLASGKGLGDKLVRGVGNTVIGGVGGLGRSAITGYQKGDGKIGDMFSSAGKGITKTSAIRNASWATTRKFDGYDANGNAKFKDEKNHSMMGEGIARAFAGLAGIDTGIQKAYSSESKALAGEETKLRNALQDENAQLQVSENNARNFDNQAADYLNQANSAHDKHEQAIDHAVDSSKLRDQAGSALDRINDRFNRAPGVNGKVDYSKDSVTGAAKLELDAGQFGKFDLKDLDFDIFNRAFSSSGITETEFYSLKNSYNDNALEFREHANDYNTYLNQAYDYHKEEASFRTQSANASTNAANARSDAATHTANIRENRTKLDSILKAKKSNESSSKKVDKAVE